jgi:hypothetical protein
MHGSYEAVQFWGGPDDGKDTSVALAQPDGQVHRAAYAPEGCYVLTTVAPCLRRLPGGRRRRYRRLLAWYDRRELDYIRAAGDTEVRGS